MYFMYYSLQKYLKSFMFVTMNDPRYGAGCYGCFGKSPYNV